MSSNFKELRAGMSPEAQLRAQARAQAALDEISDENGHAHDTVESTREDAAIEANAPKPQVSGSKSGD